YDPTDTKYPDDLTPDAKAKLKKRFVDFSTVVRGGPIRVNDTTLKQLEEVQVPKDIRDRLGPLMDNDFGDKEVFFDELSKLFTTDEVNRWQQFILNFANNATVLAQIDPSTYQSMVDSKRAMMESAKANVDAAEKLIEADIEAVKAAEQKKQQLVALADQYE